MKKFIVVLILSILVACNTDKNNNNDQDHPKDGKYDKFNKNGDLKVTGYYKDNKKTGLWKYFSNGGALEKVIMYSSDTIFLKLNTEDFVYEDLKLDNLKVPTPKLWNTKINSDTPNLLLTSTKETNESDYYNPTVTISKDVLNNQIFEEYINAQVSELEKYKEVKIINKQKSDSRKNTYQIIYITKFEDFTLATYMLILNNNEDIIIFNGSVDAKWGYNYKLLFLEMGYSIKFIN